MEPGEGVCFSPIKFVFAGHNDGITCIRHLFFLFQACALLVSITPVLTTQNLFIFCFFSVKMMSCCCIWKSFFFSTCIIHMIKMHLYITNDHLLIWSLKIMLIKYALAVCDWLTYTSSYDQSFMQRSQRWSRFVFFRKEVIYVQIYSQVNKNFMIEAHWM